MRGRSPDRRPARKSPPYMWWAARRVGRRLYVHGTASPRSLLTMKVPGTERSGQAQTTGPWAAGSSAGPRRHRPSGMRRRRRRLMPAVIASRRCSAEVAPVVPSRSRSARWHCLRIASLLTRSRRCSRMTASKRALPALRALPSDSVTTPTPCAVLVGDQVGGLQVLRRGRDPRLHAGPGAVRRTGRRPSR